MCARSAHLAHCVLNLGLVGSWLPGVQYVLPVPAVVLNAEGIGRVNEEGMCNKYEKMLLFIYATERVH